MRDQEALQEINAQVVTAKEIECLYGEEDLILDIDHYYCATWKEVTNHE